MDKDTAPSNMDKLGDLLNEYPLLWTLYALVLFLPVAAGIYYFFAPKRLDATAHHKKTDEPTPDDKIVEERPTENVEATKNKRIIKDTPEVEEVKDEKTIIESSTDVIQRTGTSESDNTNSEDNDTVVTRSHDPDSVSRDPIEAESLDTSHDIEELEAEPVVENRESENEQADTKEQVQKASQEKGDQDALQNGYHIANGHDDVGVVNGDLSDPSEEQRWSFPPVLEQFDLMDTETDPAELEAIFADERLREVYLDVTSDGPGLGISIVGGQGSPSGDLPIIIKRVLPGSLTEQEGRLKSGDELVAANETLLVGVSKDIAIDALSNLHGRVRVLVLQDD